MRVPQRRQARGSQKWLQLLVNERSELLSSSLASYLPAGSAEKIRWLSPLRDDNYAEYRDGDFLARLGIDCPRVSLPDFWPSNGPQWDALGKAGEHGPFLLVEAKANVPELISSCGASSDDSLRLIKQSLKATQDHLGCTGALEWTDGFYQCANRLAHLFLLRKLNRQDAYLVFIYFLNDESHLPTSLEQWRGALALQKKLMGLERHKLRDFVIDLFLDTRGLGE